jgi:hypothetical protein
LWGVVGSCGELWGVVGSCGEVLALSYFSMMLFGYVGEYQKMLKITYANIWYVVIPYDVVDSFLVCVL